MKAICASECVINGCKKIEQTTIHAGAFEKAHPYGTCQSYEFPQAKWAREKICPMSKTASIKATLATAKDRKKLNPLKASKRGA